MLYHVYVCRRAYSLFLECRDEFGLYLPVERKRITDKKTGKTSVWRGAAIPGYIFAPDGMADGLLKTCRPVFDLKPNYVDGIHSTVTAEDLAAVQKLLNEEYEAGRPRRKVFDFEPGDPVTVFGTDVFDGWSGTFSRYKGGGRGRISTSFGYIDVELSFIQKDLS